MSKIQFWRGDCALGCVPIQLLNIKILSCLKTHEATRIQSLLYYNSVQNVLRKIKKSSNVIQDLKTLISVFAYVLSTTSAKNLFLQGRRDTKSWFHVVLRFFLFPKILRSWSLLAQQLVRHVAYEVSYTKYQVPFCLWWMELILKLWKITSYHTKGCRYQVPF